MSGLWVIVSSGHQVSLVTLLLSGHQGGVVSTPTFPRSLDPTGETGSVFFAGEVVGTITSRGPHVWNPFCLSSWTPLGAKQRRRTRHDRSSGVGRFGVRGGDVLPPRLWRERPDDNLHPFLDESWAVYTH